MKPYKDNPLIQIKNLSKAYPGAEIKAVDNLSLNIKPGEIVSLVGTSGCGKTTTLRMINLLVEPSDGDILIDGQSYKETSPVQWRRGIGHIVQKAALLPHLNIRRNISILSEVLKRPQKEIEKRVDELIELLELRDKGIKERFPHELSGGQQQRVAIARALMENPPILLMDEPFSALDPVTRKGIHHEILKLNKFLKKTIILVTHDLKEAFDLSDQIMVMNAGKIMQKGSKDDLCLRPENSFVQNFIKGHLDD